VTKIAIVLAVAIAGAVGATAVVPALASGTHKTTGQASARALASRVMMIAPVAWRGHLSRAATGKAVSTCVYYAAKAGWANNGYYAGDLVTAATVCVAESGGDPHLIVCDDQSGNITGEGDWPSFKCPAGYASYDRGLWQLNTVGAKNVKDKCAFDPVCNAGAAYQASGLGISFAPWSSYDNQTYAAPFLDLVQAAVTNLANGTVTSALLGECLAAASHGRVVVSNCGTGWTSERWSIAGGKLRSGTLCATVTNPRRGRPMVVLAHCARQKAQDWSVFGRYELRNAADGKCLTDPGSSLTAGTQMDVTICANAKKQTWWLP